MKKAMLTPAFLVFVTFLTVDLAQAQVCGNITVWRNNNHTCLPRAVCADVHDSFRDWYNGTTCHETRALHNCFCSSGPCPVHNPAHELFASLKHKIYTCEPKCQLPYCTNIPTLSSGGATAMKTEHQSTEFHNLSFNRLECRCPRHHNPNSKFGVDGWSVKSAGTRNNQGLHVCQNSGSDSQLPDPC